MILKRSIKLRGRQTSISLEDEFYAELVFIAEAGKTSVSQLVARIESEPDRSSNLSSAVRVFVLRYALRYRDEVAKWAKRTEAA